jgi:hypothetical protein
LITAPTQIRPGRSSGQGDSGHRGFQFLGSGGTHNLRTADLGNDGDFDIIGANWSVLIPPSPGQRRVFNGENPLEIWANLSGRKTAAITAPAGGRLAPDKWTCLEVDNRKFLSLGFAVELRPWPGIGHQETPGAIAVVRAPLENVRAKK